MRQMVCLLLLMCLPVACFASPQGDVLDNVFDRPDYRAQQFFDDLQSVPWAQQAVTYLTKYRVISQTPERLFYPDRQVTRAEFVKMLVLAMGIYDPSPSTPFEDSRPGDWHYPFVSTAQKRGIVSGRSETEFGVNEPVTQQEMAVFVCRLADALGIVLPVSQSGTQSAFSEDDGVALWAADSVSRLYAANMLPIATDIPFLPQVPATRAQACQIIYLLAIQ